MHHDTLAIVEALGEDVEQPAEVLGFERVEILDGKEVPVDASLCERSRSVSHRVAALNNGKLVASLQTKDGVESELGDGIEVLVDRVTSGPWPSGERQAARGCQ